MLFLRHLPPAIRLQLTEDDHEDVRALAEKADRCAASIHRHQQAAAPIFSATNDNSSEVEELEEFSISTVGAGVVGAAGNAAAAARTVPTPSAIASVPSSSSST